MQDVTIVDVQDVENDDPNQHEPDSNLSTQKTKVQDSDAGKQPSSDTSSTNRPEVIVGQGSSISENVRIMTSLNLLTEVQKDLASLLQKIEAIYSDIENVKIDPVTTNNDGMCLDGNRGQTTTKNSKTIIINSSMSQPDKRTNIKGNKKSRRVINLALKKEFKAQIDSTNVKIDATKYCLNKILTEIYSFTENTQRKSYMEPVFTDSGSLGKKTNLNFHPSVSSIFYRKDEGVAFNT